jgi:hypothetical protein
MSRRIFEATVTIDILNKKSTTGLIFVNSFYAGNIHGKSISINIENPLYVNIPLTRDQALRLANAIIKNYE